MTEPTTSGPAPRRPPWLGWPVGARVVVRRRLAEGGYSDVLGYLVSVHADDGVLVATRGGPVQVPAAEIAVGKLIPPPPPRRSPRPPG